MIWSVTVAQSEEVYWFLQSGSLREKSHIINIFNRLWLEELNLDEQIEILEQN